MANNLRATETQVAEELLYMLLSTLGVQVYKYVASEKASLPCIVYNLQSPGKDVGEVGAHRIMANLVYQVKVIGKLGDLDEIDTIATELDNALHLSAGEVATGNGVVYAVVRESPISYPEVLNGETYIHRGGLYRIYAQASTV